MFLFRKKKEKLESKFVFPDAWETTFLDEKENSLKSRIDTKTQTSLSKIFLNNNLTFILRLVQVNLLYFTFLYTHTSYLNMEKKYRKNINQRRTLRIK